MSVYHIQPIFKDVNNPLISFLFGIFQIIIGLIEIYKCKNVSVSNAYFFVMIKGNFNLIIGMHFVSLIFYQRHRKTPNFRTLTTLHYLQIILGIPGIILLFGKYDVGIFYLTILFDLRCSMMIHYSTICAHLLRNSKYLSFKPPISKLN